MAVGGEGGKEGVLGGREWGRWFIDVPICLVVMMWEIE